LAKGSYRLDHIDDGIFTPFDQDTCDFSTILIIAVLASQATIWHSLATIRNAIQQTNASILAACGSDERLCQVAAHRGQIELGEIMVRTRPSDGFSCGYSRYNPCWIKASREDGLNECHEVATRSACAVGRIIKTAAAPS
jgi:hypothetical protein